MKVSNSKFLFDNTIYLVFSKFFVMFIDILALNWQGIAAIEEYP